MPTVLLVDDDLLGRKMMGQVLNRQGYHVLSAPDGQTALEKMAVETPDLILTDIKMPGMDGFEVAGRVKSNPETSDIPVILFTGLDTADNHIRALDMGVDDYISKCASHAEIVAIERAPHTACRPYYGTGGCV